MKFMIRFLLSFALLFQQAFGRIVDEQGKVLPEVVAVFSRFEPLMNDEQKALFQNPTLENLNAIGQKLFLRAPSLERKDLTLQASPFEPYISPDLRVLFEKIGDVGNIDPSQKHYRYIFLNGSTVQNMRQRWRILLNLIEKKLIEIDDSTELVILTGERDLFPEEPPEVLLNASPLTQDPSWQKPDTLPKTEADAALWIFEQTLLPASLQKMRMTLVRAPKNEKIDPDGTVRWIRPSTQDTIRTWVSYFAPTPGKCLCVSSQPFVYYQDVAMRSLLAKMNIKDFEIEGVGEEVTSPDKFEGRVPIYLDNLARATYCELELKRASSL